MRQFLRTRIFRVCALLLSGVLLYGLAGFLLAPKWLRSTLLTQIPATLGASPRVGEIHVNPFSMQVEIRDFSLGGPGGEPLLGFRRLLIDFELSSIWHRAYSFGRIEIAAPFVNVVVSKAGTLNLSRLAPHSAPKADSNPAAIPPLRIRSFKVSEGLLTFDDRSHPSDFAERFEPVNFELQDFTSGVRGGRFTFSGLSKLGERVEWQGRVSVQPIESEGEFKIVGLRARTLWSYLEDRVGFVVDSGTIDLNASYRFAVKNSSLTVDVPRVAVAGLAVRPKDSAVDWVTVPQLLVSHAGIDFAHREAHVDSITLTGLKLLGWLAPDGSLNLLKLSLPPATPVPAKGPSTIPANATPVPAPAPAPVQPWAVSLSEFALRDATVSLEDRGTRPAATVVVAPLSVTVGGASSDLGKPVRVAFNGKIVDSGTLDVAGTVTPQPLAADLRVKLAGIELAAVQPYLAQRTSLTLLGGRLSADSRVRYGQGQPTLAFDGNLRVADLHTVDNALHDDFINCELLDLQGIKFQQGPSSLDIDRITASKAYARVIIEPDGSLNVHRVLVGPGATLIVPAAPGSTGPPVTVTAPIVAPARVKPAKRRGNATRLASSAPGSGPDKGPLALLPMTIKKIVLQDSQANFADLSVTPNFATGIQNLQGSIVALSSRPNAHTTIDLHGSVDQFAPVSIAGEANVLGASLFADLAMSFRNIELSTFNPYSGKFAGYNISEGKLSTELHYKVDGRKLDAQHHITIEQLEFGEKTESKNAVSLPIKLAVALLKNRDGVIELDIPVKGSLDDPQFQLGPLIWKVLAGILERAVAAPFALLGSLFGGGPELQFIDFEPGAADLDAAGAAKAKAIAQALRERPQLKIEVPIAVVGELDRPVLIEARFQEQLQTAWSAGVRAAATGQAVATSQTAAAGQAGATAGVGVPSFDQLTPAARLEVLTRAYRTLAGMDPAYPDDVTAIKPKADAIAAKIDFLTRTLRAQINITEADLTVLGQARAANLQSALLTGTAIDPERVFLVANDKAKQEGDRVRLELSLR